MEKIISYLKENSVIGIILIAIVAILVLLIIVAIIRAIVKSKKVKTNAQSPKTSQSAPVTVVETKPNVIAPAKEQTQTELKIKQDAQVEEKNTTVSTEQNNSTIEQKSKPIDEDKPEPFVTENEEKEEEKPKAVKTPPEIKSEQKKTAKKKNTSADNKQPEKKAEEPSKKQAEKKITTAEPTVKTAYAGKWVISVSSTSDDGTSTYCFELRASNGEKLLSSVDYKSLLGAKNGIKTYKTNIEKNNFTVAQNKKGDFFFKLLNGSGHLLSTGETYPNKTNCENAIDSVKRFAATAVIVVEENED